MNHERKMKLMQDLYNVQKRKEKQYLSSKGRKGRSGRLASTKMRDLLKEEGK